MDYEKLDANQQLTFLEQTLVRLEAQHYATVVQAVAQRAAGQSTAKTDQNAAGVEKSIVEIRVLRDALKEAGATVVESPARTPGTRRVDPTRGGPR